MSDSTPAAHVPVEGSPQSPVGGTYKTVGTTLTVVVVGGVVLTGAFALGALARRAR